MELKRYFQHTIQRNFQRPMFHLAVNSNQLVGYRSIQWKGTNNLGEQVAAGIYIYMIQAGDFRETKKMILLK